MRMCEPCRADAARAGPELQSSRMFKWRWRRCTIICMRNNERADDVLLALTSPPGDD